MKTRLIGLAAVMLSWLPLRLNQAVGSVLGRIAWMTNSRARRVTEFNLAHCFPDTSASSRQALARKSLIHTGKQLTECTWIWHRPVEQTLALIKETRGESLLLEALASPRGLIMVSPHMGNWELCSLVLASQASLTYFYRSPRNRALEPLLLKWRARMGGQPASLDTGGIRESLRIVKKGGMVGILPDQEPDRDNGVFAPFFNQPALTMTLLSRLAARSDAQVIFSVAERLPDSQGWRIHYLPGSPGITSDDLVEAATAVNHDIERCIAINPPQYLWDYKRFDTLSDGTRRRYDNKP